MAKTIIDVRAKAARKSTFTILPMCVGIFLLYWLIDFSKTQTLISVSVAIIFGCAPFIRFYLWKYKTNKRLNSLKQQKDFLMTNGIKGNARLSSIDGVKHLGGLSVYSLTFEIKSEAKTYNYSIKDWSFVRSETRDLAYRASLPKGDKEVLSIPVIINPKEDMDVVFLWKNKTDSGKMVLPVPYVSYRWRTLLRP